MSNKKEPSSNTTTQICPYLDTINRTLLDFDFEHSCSITLQSSPHIYGCLVCGKFFLGRGRHTPAYTHSVDTNHFVYIHLARGTFHCLPDDYIIEDASLKDISNALHPLYTKEEIRNLDGYSDDDDEKRSSSSSSTGLLARDLFGRRYLPGFVGLNNLNKTDYLNAVVQALGHVKPIRDFFLSYNGPNGPPTEITVTSTTKKKGKLKKKKKLINHDEFSHLAQCFGELVRKMWSDKRFKSTIDPHMLVQAVSVASKKKYHIGNQVDVSEFLSWFLHQLHVGVNNGGSGSSKKSGSNIVKETFGGSVEVTTLIRRRRRRRNQKKKKKRGKKRKRKGELNKEEEQMPNDAPVVEQPQPPPKHPSNYYSESSSSSSDDEDDRIGSDSEESNQEQQEETETQKTYIEETTTTTTTNFLQLTLDIPEKPLFKDDNGGLVIPQEPLSSLLSKFDGTTFSDALASSSSSSSSKQQEKEEEEEGVIMKRKRYRLKELPPYLILHLSRFRKNSFTVEKNPTIVIFPVKNLDLGNYVFSDDKDENDNNKRKEEERKEVPSEEEVRKMSVKELKNLLIQHNHPHLASRHYTEKSELIETVLNFLTASLPDLLSHKYNLVANITHNTPAEVGREGRRNPLEDGFYKCHVQHVASGQWYEMQDLHVQETMAQLIGLSESYVLIFERKRG